MSSSSEAATRRRVKLYMLNEERQWNDKGTGHVSALYNDASCICLVVISENDGSPLLESKIQPETAYQKQQDTLIVWSEGDNVDLALSFQEKAGCDDIWEKICSVQGKDPSVEITQEVVEETDDTDDVESYSLSANPELQDFELPACELSRLDEIAEIFSTHLHIIQKREGLVAAVDGGNYIRQLIDLFHKAEDLEDLNSLHCLYEIFRQLILFNKQVLYETLFSDDVIMDVIGILEYSPGGRTRHRDFLKNQANFKEVLPLHNSKLINKIHQTYRVQYIQDCCLPPPSLFDEQSMSDLKAFIATNKMEILSALQEDRDCMMRLFTCLRSPETSDSHRRELALFVKEFCNLSIQTDRKEAFLSTLSSHGALSTVEFLFSINDREVKSAALTILQAFVENQPSIVRDHACKEGNRQPTDDVLVNLMISQLLEDPDPELGDAYQLAYMIRILIDPDSMNNGASRIEKSEFLGFFYRRCMDTLTKPLFDHTEEEIVVDDNYHSALVLSNVLDLLIFCIENHTYHFKNYCLRHEVLKRVMVLLKSEHKFLVLSVLRLVRKVVQMKEEFYNRYLSKNKLFKPIIECFIANGHRYNMIDSAILELFEFILMENVETIIDHIVEEFWDVLSDVTYVSTFKRFKDRYDASKRPIKAEVSALFKEGMSSSSEAATRRRVKLYMLNEERQWNDKGTGHVSALYNDASCICLVVISENDGSPLLESKIQPETAYQKQQDTLIVWSEGDNVDLALSFQEKAGCDDIWEKICSVQGKDPSVEITQEVVEETDDTDDVESYSLSANPELQDFELPACELSRLDEIAEIFSTHLHIIQKREGLVAAVDGGNYIRQLIDLFHKAEDLEDLNSLHCLYEIFRQLILFNKQVLYETLFSDDVIMDVIGILEYSPGGRTRHRDFLKNQANFKEVLPLHNSKLINKIHQTYRVQYIQDCCLPPPSLFDEQSMSDLKAFIATNKMEILSALQEDRDCMMRLFTCLRSPETSDSHRRELALFVKEFCNLSIQTDRKEAFLSTLSSHGALSTVEFLFSINDREVKSAALTILQAFVENQPSIVRDHACKEGNRQPTDDVLVNLMISQLLEDPDPELGDAYQLAYMIRILIDPDSMNNGASRIEKSEFLGFFYRRCMDTLTKPLFDHTEEEIVVDDNYHSALVLSNVLDLLIFCIENHTYHFKNYCLRHEVLKRVMVLLKSEHKFLVLSVLRLVRKVVQMKEEFYNRYLSKNKLFKPIIECFIANGHRYNMIDSAILELFEFILMENVETIIDHIVEEFWDVLSDVTYVSTFKRFKDRYDASKRPIKAEVSALFKEGILASNSNIPSLGATVNPHFVCAPAFDEEEQWFNQDDEKKEDTMEVANDASTAASGNLSLEEGGIPSLPFSSSPPPSSILAASYTTKDDDDDLSPHLLNRRVGHSPFPPITINIKSMNLGLVKKDGEKEENQEGDNSPIPRILLKRSPTDVIKEDVMTSRHSKQMLLDNEQTENNSCCNIEGKNSNADDMKSIGNNNDSHPVVGLVDYSDEESDEEEQDQEIDKRSSSPSLLLPPCTSDSRNETKVEEESSDPTP
nr:hypothetical transcript [Hymenolepis microstoma]